ncbi:TetR/AcrR family transcriptional regulator [Planococcus rifietoensis]|uniref:TetR/AcrR family transcriptional regulator n=1 Tax=Planococcus rifietoensis TaxID=200991 RepID=UPI0038511DB9
MQQSIALFVDKGYSATSIQDIVDALGVTKGSFYYPLQKQRCIANGYSPAIHR